MNKDWTVNGIYSVTFETVCISRCDWRFFFFCFGKEMKAVGELIQTSVHDFKRLLL